jgi:hypothetical protein
MSIGEQTRRLASSSIGVVGSVDPSNERGRLQRWSRLRSSSCGWRSDPVLDLLLDFEGSLDDPLEQGTLGIAVVVAELLLPELFRVPAVNAGVRSHGIENAILRAEGGGGVVLCRSVTGTREGAGGDPRPTPAPSHFAPVHAASAGSSAPKPLDARPATAPEGPLGRRPTRRGLGLASSGRARENSVAPPGERLD